jgi:hypothetical protein
MKRPATRAATLRRVVPVVAVALILGCTHNVAPKVTPTKIAAVQPPIHARAILMITPSFETYTTQSSQGINHYNYQLGHSAAGALQDLVSGSFDHGTTQRLSDAEVIRWLAAPADTSAADLLLVPYFETGGVKKGLLTQSADVRLRLDARSYRGGGATYSWTALGHTGRAVTSLRGLTGSALEQALGALSDSLGAHRGDLEGDPTR